MADGQKLSDNQSERPKEKNDRLDKSSDASEARHATPEDIAQVESSRTNRSFGSMNELAERDGLKPGNHASFQLLEAVPGTDERRVVAERPKPGRAKNAALEKGDSGALTSAQEAKNSIVRGDAGSHKAIVQRFVKSGDTLSGIARENMDKGASERDVSEYVKIIAKDNRISNPNELQAGAMLTLRPFERADTFFQVKAETHTGSRYHMQEGASFAEVSQTASPLVTDGTHKPKEAPRVVTDVVDSKSSKFFLDTEFSVILPDYKSLPVPWNLTQSLPKLLQVHLGPQDNEALERIYHKHLNGQNESQLSPSAVTDIVSLPQIGPFERRKRAGYKCMTADDIFSWRRSNR